MSIRGSMVSGSLDSMIAAAMRKHRMLRVHESEFDATQIVHALFEKSLECIKAAEDAMPAHANELFEYSEDTTVQVVMPVPDSFSLRRYNADNIILFKEYKEAYRCPEGTPNAIQRGVCLTIISPFPLPIVGQYHGGDEAQINRARDAILLSEDNVGHGAFDRYLTAAALMDKLLLNLNYMEGFARGVSKLCTTEGITKRLWPECTTFLRPALSSVIESARIQPYPKYAKSVLREYGGGVDAVTTKYWHAQLKAITDVVLTSLLMPDEDAMLKEASTDENDAAVCFISDVTTVSIRWD